MANFDALQVDALASLQSRDDAGGAAPDLPPVGAPGPRCSLADKTPLNLVSEFAKRLFSKRSGTFLIWGPNLALDLRDMSRRRGST